jgi:tRNA(Ile)-lysidine synthase
MAAEAPVEDFVLRTVRSTLSDHGMIRRGDPVVVAVSGGADSVCLLDVLARLAPAMDLALVVAHFDHGLRGEEDDSETRFVLGLAEERGAAFDTEKAASTLDGEGGREARAREARYAFLERVRQRHGARRVATAHTLDDQAETVLMRLLRGTGPSGLSAIPPVREPGIVRPLIRVRRREVEAYLEARGLPWRTDPTNLQAGPLRNRIRLELLPRLVAHQPRLVEHLGELADLAREEDAFMEGLARDWLEARGESPEEGLIRLPRPALAGLPAPLRRRVLRRALGETSGGLAGVHRRHIASVEALIREKRPQARIELPGGRCVRRSYEWILFGPREAGGRPGFQAWFPAPGSYPVEEAGLRVVLEEVPRSALSTLSAPPWTAYLDAGRIRYPLEMRPRRPGDRFVPLGMQGSRKMKAFLIDLKVPAEEREGVPVLLSGGTPVWLCGLRIDDRFKVTDGTDRVLVVRIERADGRGVSSGPS